MGHRVYLYIWYLDGLSQKTRGKMRHLLHGLGSQCPMTCYRVKKSTYRHLCEVHHVLAGPTWSGWREQAGCLRAQHCSATVCTNPNEELQCHDERVLQDYHVSTCMSSELHYLPSPSIALSVSSPSGILFNIQFLAILWSERFYPLFKKKNPPELCLPLIDSKMTRSGSYSHPWSGRDVSLNQTV